MNPRSRSLLRNFLLELLIYGALLLIYFLAVLRFLGQPLNELFRLDPWVYAVATLILIVVQGVLLEMVTSFLVERLGLERVE